MTLGRFSVRKSDRGRFQCHLVKSFKTLAVPFTGACLPSSYTEVYALEYIRALLAGTSIFSIIHAYINIFDFGTASFTTLTLPNISAKHMRFALKNEVNKQAGASGF